LRHATFFHLVFSGIILLLMFGMLAFTSRSYTQSGPLEYDSRANDLTLIGSQITQYNLIRFDTANGECKLRLPSTSDIVSTLSVPAGNFTALVIAADGCNTLKIT
jgi:hypothetical protein